MIAAISVCLAIVLASVALLHVFWAFGGSWGYVAAIPERSGKPVFTPSRTVTLLVAGALLAAAGCAVDRGGVLAVPGTGPVAHAGCWVLTAIFGARALGEGKYVGFTKRVRDTTFARNDKWIYSPLCALLAAGFLTLALGR